MKLISFVFSFRNEEKNLKNLIDRVHKAVKKTENWNYELIFVNDDSTDNSEKTLINLQKDFIGLSLSGENGEEVGFDEENEEYQYEKTPVGNEIEI